jgi:hypothetical protein
MSRVWKPGDVAIVASGEIMIRRTDGRWEHGDQTRFPIIDAVARPRPVVVINPEDRAQVERLADEFCTVKSSGWVDQMQAALRSLVTPPKPEEPLGLGAVVEDAEGTPWVRCENVDLEPHWYARNKRRDYPEINVVRVLSDGWTPDASGGAS